ncbi:amidohydrolase [Mesorhizobium sp. KR9-304]|uniref:amidohydrolase family protein n=1 Tax=Mesorhizobium sp. KR9-304 TaxID=3156614 RepID=UPI0032B453E7
MLVDTHLHLIDKSRLDYPWLSGVPALDRDFLYAEYARDARRAGITDVLHMEVDVAPSDIAGEIEFVRDQSTRPDSLIRGAISACRPEAEAFPTMLERALADPFVKGFRRILHTVDDGISQGALFRENLKRLSGTRLTFDICMFPRQANLALALATLAPDVAFILDHCGVPDVKAGDFDAWKRGIAEIAARPNVVAKISGIVAYADSGTWTADTLRPYVEHIIDRFGWDRVVWGSDWPVCTLGGGLLAWVAATHAVLSGCSEDERDSLFWKNADRVWQLGLGLER